MDFKEAGGRSSAVVTNGLGYNRAGYGVKTAVRCRG